MTNPKHTDTSCSDDLVKRLRNLICHGDLSCDTLGDCDEAADRIEALEAENERLRDDSWFDQFEEQEQLRDNAEQRLSVVEAENERLREALRDLLGMWSTRTVNAARAALGEKQ